MVHNKETRLLAAAVSDALRKPGDTPFLLHRDTHLEQGTQCAHSAPYVAITYEEVADASAEVAAGLRSLGVPRSSCVGIASENRVEWLEADFACAFGDFMNVGLHLGWPPQKLAAIIESAECSVIICSIDGAASVAEALQLLRARPIKFDEPFIVLLPRVLETDSVVQNVGALLPSAQQWSEIRQLGQRPDASTYTGFGFKDDVASAGLELAMREIDSDVDGNKPFTLMYSSGSSGGPPKATVNTKADWLKSNCSAGAFANFDTVEDRRGISYLSLCHGADRGICWQGAFGGGTIGFARGESDLDGCLQDLAELRPTFFLGFAPFWTLLYQRHLAELLPAVDRELDLLLSKEFESLPPEEFKRFATQHPHEWQDLRDIFLLTRQGGSIRRDLLDKMRNRLGGCLRSAATGGSRTPEAVRRFMFFLLEDGSNGVTDSYGSTEFPGIASNGEIAPDVELKLIACPGGYSPDDRPHPRGEILVRRKDGSRTSYWKNEELTASAWDVDGWYHTGDVGLLNYKQEQVPNRYSEIPRAKGHNWTAGVGYLQVIDRVKQLEELYWNHDSLWVSTQYLENLYSTVPGFDHVVLTTDRNEEGFIAIVLLSNGKTFADDISADNQAHRSAKCLQQLKSIGKTHQLAPYEIPVGVLVIVPTATNPKPWTQENGLLTITGKVNRVKVKDFYHLEWMAQYATVASGTLSPERRRQEPSRLGGVDGGTHTRPNAATTEASESVKVLKSRLRLKVKDEAGPVPHNNEPVVVQRANRVADCRLRRRRRRPPDNILKMVEELETPSATDGAFSITVQQLDGTGLHVEILPSDTVLMLKCRIQSCHAVPADIQVLVWEGQKLDNDSATMEQIGVRLGSCIHLSLRSRAVEICEEKLTDQTLRGRDWLENRVSDDGRYEELRFQFELCAPRHAVGDSVEWISIGSPDDVATIQQQFETVRRLALHIRKNAKVWEVSNAGARRAATQAIEEVGEQFHHSVTEALREPKPFDRLVKVINALLTGRRKVEQAKFRLGLCSMCADMKAAFEELDGELLKLRRIGDTLNVDSRSLPVTWRFALDWILDEWREVRDIRECILGCGQNVFADEMGTHIDAGCDATGTTSLPVTEETGVSMGADTAVLCEITGLTIDPENDDLTPKMTNERCATRTPRVHSVSRGKDRLPWAHDAVAHARELIAQLEPPQQQVARQLLLLVDSHFDNADDFFTRDKQGLYWLNEFVQFKSMGADVGSPRYGHNTPASLVCRACDAFALRPALGVPDLGDLPAEMAIGCISRETPLDVLPQAASMTLTKRNSFLWITYQDLGLLVTRVAAGLLRLGIAPGSYVAVSGYNDFEFAVADFAIATAGLVCVPIHGTYSNDAAATVINKVHCVALCFMRDHANVETRANAGGKWSVQGLADQCESLTSFVVMDAPAAGGWDVPNLRDGATTISGSFVEWVASPSVVSDILPNPFDAKGAVYGDIGGEQKRVTTVLFTSGSSGAPKAVAVGVNEFVTDISFACPDTGVTVSYIPLSHGSDRYKVWSHIVHGARVGFCQFGAENWEWRERNKTDSPGLSAVDLLFEQIRRLKPTSMSCPPNIWAGLHEIYRRTGNLLEVARLLGPNIQTMVTGGAPTPSSDVEFAKVLCRCCGAAFSDSYGTTENGAVTADGFQPRPRYQNVEVQLIDNGNFTSRDSPFPRGEVIVQCETLALGYQGDPEKTADAFFTVSKDDKGQSSCSLDIFPIPKSSGRWYRTGDLGWFDQTGRLHLAGRVSSSTIFGLVVDTVERQLEDLEAVRHAVVFLQHDDKYDTAVPLVTVIVSAASDSPGLRAAVDGRLRAILSRSTKSTDIQTQVAVDAREEWSIENGLLTATLKKRRTVAMDHFACGLFGQSSTSAENKEKDVEASLRATVEGLVLRGVVSAEDAQGIGPPRPPSPHQRLEHHSSKVFREQLSITSSQQRRNHRKQFRQFLVVYQMLRQQMDPAHAFRAILGNPHELIDPYRGSDLTSSGCEVGTPQNADVGSRGTTVLTRSGPLDLTPDLARLVRERWLSREHALRIMEAQKWEIFQAEQTISQASSDGKPARKKTRKHKHKQSRAPEVKGGSSWAVIVAGGEGFQYGIYNLEPVFELCVRQLGRDRVILVAPIEEIIEDRRRAAETGIPVFSPTLSPEQNRIKNLEKLAEFENRFKFIREHGGADYDGPDCTAETVMRILAGQPRREGDKVLPRDPSLLGSVFFCFGGHGGSFRSIKRNSPILTTTKCDLCSQAHTLRPKRELSSEEVGSQWPVWLQEDCNYVLKYSNTATHSLEHDRVLCEDDEVVTPFGMGRVVGRVSVAAQQVDRAMHALWPSSKFPLVGSTGHYTSPFLLTFGTQHSPPMFLPHPFLYKVVLNVTNEFDGDERLNGGSCWRVLSLLHLFSTVHGIQLPPSAVASLEGFLDMEDHRSVRDVCREDVQARCKDNGYVLLRRDVMCLPFGPREYNHFHSSLKTREWAFGMPHAAPLGVYGPVAWRHSPVTSPTHLLVWQQIFAGLHGIRQSAPNCRILALTEACFSGGAMKFMDDERLTYWNKLESWPVFLISTAGEAQSSGSGFMQGFISGVARSIKRLSRRTGKTGVSLLQQAEEARTKFRKWSNFGAVHGATGPISGTSDVHFSFSTQSSVEKEDIATWFVQHNCNSSGGGSSAKGR